MNVKDLIKNIIYGAKANSESYIKYLRSKGMRIGENTTIYVPTKTSIDETRPWMIEIGNNVNITEGVTILTHGYDWSVFKVKYGDILGSAGRVTIGNNVFIGMNTIVLKGVSVGDNSIIGAGSVLTSGGVYPENSVIVGNPARVIGTIDNYREKMITRQIPEAVECFKCYKEVFNKVPAKEVFREFFWLFEKNDETQLCEAFTDIMKLEGNYDLSLYRWRDVKPLFSSYDEFVAYCEKGTESGENYA